MNDTRSTYDITKQSGLAKLIRLSNFIVLDEASMSYKAWLEVRHHALQDIMTQFTLFRAVITLGGYSLNMLQNSEQAYASGEYIDWYPFNISKIISTARNNKLYVIL